MEEGRGREGLGHQSGGQGQSTIWVGSRARFCGLPAQCGSLTSREVFEY